MSELRKKQLDEICERQLFYLPYFRGMLRAVEQSQYPPDLLLEPILDNWRRGWAFCLGHAGRESCGRD